MQNRMLQAECHLGKTTFSEEISCGFLDDCLQKLLIYVASEAEIAEQLSSENAGLAAADRPRNSSPPHPPPLYKSVKSSQSRRILKSRKSQIADAGKNCEKAHENCGKATNTQTATGVILPFNPGLRSPEQSVILIPGS
jgi:hypothetical protein